MIYPTATEILHCVDHALLDASDPELGRMSVKSALATCRHMVRHVEVRLRLETAILLDDIDKTRSLLTQLAAQIDTLGEAQASLAQRIRSTLDNESAELESAGDDLALVRARALNLREQVYQTLASLQALQMLDAGIKDTAHYRQARGLIREYIAYELQQEARLIAPAFKGQGPRR
ncbi:hypothetical protein [Paraburkholderia unamae]|uniref:Uncharacterized protein n=1 Tax=Paraburkholderia unamae TaxID=219649 RepID=A0ABX5KFT8_9BURK|nr:hypothetical protein [Paraburkholderia unamae]PVX75695.1 hypothetical protein C7402_117107 [Paraburkholderia unamae]